MLDNDESVTLLEDCVVKLVLSENAQNQFKQGHIGHKELATYISQLRLLSEDYTSKRESTGLEEITAEQASAYALYYLTLNFVKVRHLLKIAYHTETIAPHNILDVGCGPGTASLACLSSFDSNLNCLGVERSNAMGTLASKIFNEMSKNRFCESNIFSVANGLDSATKKYDLIISSNYINELPQSQTQAILDSLVDKLEETGKLIIIEPALKDITQSLMQYRNTLLQKHKKLKVTFPCTRNDDCPMLKKSTEDWCHGTLQAGDGVLKASRLTKQIDQILGFNKHRLKYSAFIFEINATTSDGYRVIFPAQKTRIGSEAMICGSDYFGSVNLRKSAASESKHAFNHAKQYDLISINPRPLKIELDKSTKISII